MNIKECHVIFDQSQRRISYVHLCKILKCVITSNNTTRGKLAINFPNAEGTFVTFTNFPEAKEKLIANFPTSHVISLIMITEENSKKFAAEISLAV